MDTGTQTLQWQKQTAHFLNQTQKLIDLPEEVLKWRAAINSWSVLECIEHLNLYGKHYLPIIKKHIAESNTQPEATLKSGWLGRYFAQSMLPGNNKKSMRTFKSKNPLNIPLNKTTLHHFMDQQKEMLDLLEASKQVSLNKVKIPTSISMLIRLKLGDTFQFLINHQLRHFDQLEKALVKQQVRL